MELGRFRRQFTHPHGVTGRIVGWTLVRLNAPLYREAVSRLAPGSTERVLEIGFGPGFGIALLAARSRSVAGIDPSDVMHVQARQRNAEAIRDGRVDLRRGSADALPWNGETFDAVISLNNVLLWDPLPESLVEVRRVLRPGGRLLVGLHALAATGQSAPGHGGITEVEAFLRDRLLSAGYREVVSEAVGRTVARGLIMVARRPLVESVGTEP